MQAFSSKPSCQIELVREREAGCEDGVGREKPRVVSRVFKKSSERAATGRKFNNSQRTTGEAVRALINSIVTGEVKTASARAPACLPNTSLPTRAAWCRCDTFDSGAYGRLRSLDVLLCY